MEKQTKALIVASLTLALIVTAAIIFLFTKQPSTDENPSLKKCNIIIETMTWTQGINDGIPVVYVTGTAHNYGNTTINDTRITIYADEQMALMTSLRSFKPNETKSFAYTIYVDTPRKVEATILEFVPNNSD